MTQTAASPASTGTNAVNVTVTESAGTEYVILRFNDDTDEWTEHGDHVAGTNPSQAIRKHLAQFPEKNPAGTFVAIPTRSFKPVTVKTETVTTLKLEEAL
jgi:hypothetical protein